MPMRRATARCAAAAAPRQRAENLSCPLCDRLRAQRRERAGAALQRTRTRERSGDFPPCPSRELRARDRARRRRARRPASRYAEWRASCPRSIAGVISSAVRSTKDGALLRRVFPARVVVLVQALAVVRRDAPANAVLVVEALVLDDPRTGVVDAMQRRLDRPGPRVNLRVFHHGLV